jgi:hypothetical protein
MRFEMQATGILGGAAAQILYVVLFSLLLVQHLVGMLYHKQHILFGKVYPWETKKPS